ncbi:hypothetical protein M6I34_08050 [Burkholderiaceae bacterium FT117]|uniref:hypothetical protein n=1 Tax=Zeimonas sediminis TaxID=2944268 RepID=UPI002342EC01|nr:hypothetical protein [Zeimonas sediminis]MCM5570458.1 hypothetical protein [Zeimonas sediminis]
MSGRNRRLALHAHHQRAFTREKLEDSAMKHTIATAALFCSLLAGCDPTLPVRPDTSAIGEMPTEVALSFLQNWKAPAGLVATPVDAGERCGAINNGSMTLRNGQTFPYGKLRLLVTGTGGRYRSVNFTVAESTWTWCRFGGFGWDSENVATHRRALGEINRIGTAFAALGGQIEKP